jgi:FkbM family methyltransferase
MLYLFFLCIFFSFQNFAYIVLPHDVNGSFKVDSIKHLLPENPIILEAGAYDGTDTITMAQLWPKATIYTFEPLPEMFYVLQSKVKNYKNIFCYPLALNDCTGKSLFYVSDFFNNETIASSSLLQPTGHLQFYPYIIFNKSIEIDTINLDEWAIKNKVNYIDFMWLDIQGAELKVLKAAPKILKTIKIIFMEVAFKETYKDMPLFSEINDWLLKQGFSLEFIEPCGQMKAEGNALYIRNDA